MDWQKVIEQYPEVERHVDQTPGFTNTVEHKVFHGKEYLIIHQKSEFEGGSAHFEIVGTEARFVGEHVGPLSTLHDELVISNEALHANCGASSAQEHATVFDLAKSEVGHFSTAGGPDHGNLACVWAVRHLVFKALNRWITKSDGTAVFAPELKQCFGHSINEAHVHPGGIVISPTQGRRIGHVGILGGDPGDDARLIYSNSSSAAVWKQNFTLKSWKARYSEAKGLPVLFFPLPKKDGVPIS